MYIIAYYMIPATDGKEMHPKNKHPHGSQTWLLHYFFVQLKNFNITHPEPNMIPNHLYKIKQISTTSVF